MLSTVIGNWKVANVFISGSTTDTQSEGFPTFSTPTIALSTSRRAATGSAALRRYSSIWCLSGRLIFLGLACRPPLGGGF